ncbi:MAG: hypothetical protein ABWY04_12255 [Arthrobacter sp.]
MALVPERGIVGKALPDMEITYEAATGKSVEIIAHGNFVPSGHNPSTLPGRAMLQQSNEISNLSDHGFIGAGPSAICRLIRAHFPALAQWCTLPRLHRLSEGRRRPLPGHGREAVSGGLSSAESRSRCHPPHSLSSQ